jgi:hypothetical protein
LTPPLKVDPLCLSCTTHRGTGKAFTDGIKIYYSNYFWEARKLSMRPEKHSRAERGTAAGYRKQVRGHCGGAAPS